MSAPLAATGGSTPLPPSTRVAPTRVTCPDRPNQGNRGHHQNRTSQRQRKQRARHLCKPRAGYGTQQAAKIVAHGSARQQRHGGEWLGKRGIQSSNGIAVQGSQMEGFVAPVVETSGRSLARSVVAFRPCAASSAAKRLNRPAMLDPARAWEVSASSSDSIEDHRSPSRAWNPSARTCSSVAINSLAPSRAMWTTSSSVGVLLGTAGATGAVGSIPSSCRCCWNSAA